MALLVTVLIVLASFLIAFVYLRIKHNYNYWNRRGIKGPKPLPFLGNFKDILLCKKDLNRMLKEYYDQFPNELVIGVFMGFRPVLLVRDLECIKEIMVKEFDVFRNRGLKTTNHPITQNLFQADDELWRTLRYKLGPSFTMSKLKQWGPRLQRCLNDYTKHIDSLVESQTEHDIKHLVTTYNLAAAGACLFTLDLKAFSGNCKDMMNKISTLSKPSLMLLVRYLIDRTSPALYHYLQLFFKLKPKSYEVIEIINQFIKIAVDERKSNPEPVNDHVDLIMKIKGETQVNNHNKNNNIVICDELLQAQSVFYLSASTEGSATVVSLTLHELAFNQNIQDRVHKEIKEISEKYEGIISTYEALDEMTYLQMVFNEALRKYPIMPLIRQCGRDYVLPGTDVTIEKNTRIMIPLSGVQNDAAIFENPEVFNPERFSPENKSKVPPFAYLPFGEGPRKCIGMRFANLQALSGLAAFLCKFKVEPSERTERCVTMNSRSLNAQPLSAVWLKISRRP